MRKLLFHFNDFRFTLADGKFVAADGQFDRIAQWCYLTDKDIDSLCDAHVHDAAAIFLTLAVSPTATSFNVFIAAPFLL